VGRAELNLINPAFGNFVPVSQSTSTNPSLRNWDPRLELAFDPFADHKTSFRAGFGMFHNVDYSVTRTTGCRLPS
jgi:hypothetical protein